MSDTTLLQLAALTGVFLLAGTVKGVTGLGLPTVAMALGTLVVSVPEAAALMLLPSLLTNLWQAICGPALAALLRRLWPFLLALCLGAAAGHDLLGATASPWPLGSVLLLYGLSGLFFTPPAMSPRAERLLSLPAGVATGLLTAATGVFVIPLVPFLQAMRLERDQLVQAMGIGFSVATLALAGVLASSAASGGGGLDWRMLGLSLAALLPSLLGMLLGQRIRRRLSPPLFRRCLMLALAGLGLQLLLR